MRDDAWADLGEAGEVPDTGAVLRKDQTGRRYAAFRVGGRVVVLDDRCPHEGYPLSQGEVRDGVLTCAWHNWKFDGCSGACLFGGEAVRSYPVRVEDGRVLVDTAIDAAVERARLLASMRRTLREVDTSSALRDAIRLSRLSGDGPECTSAFAAVVGDGARRVPYGFDHALATTADLARWTEEGWLDAASALSLSITAVAEANANLGVREPPSDAAITEGTLLDDLREERHASAEARTRRIVREGGAIAGARALLPWVALHNLDYGHGAIFLAKALELSARFPEHAEDLFGALALGLAWATRETALPPWAATRRALDAVDALGGFGAEALSGSTRQDYEAAVLEGERAAAEATVAHLSAGASATSLLRASARAAARRLLRFDPTWERRRDANVTVLDITHTVTFAESCLALAPHASARELARFAVLSATFVGKVRKGDASEPLGAHDLDDAPARDSVRRLDAAGRAAAFRDLAPHVAFDAATRPIRYAHTIKTAEALFRLDRDDPEPDAVYLEALLAYVVPQRPERDHRRAAEIALRFLDDGRPPPGLY